MASVARFSMAGFNRTPSTALIFAKLARPRTKPDLLLFPGERFCFGMFEIYHIFLLFAMPPRISERQQPVPLVTGTAYGCPPLNRLAATA